MAQQTIGLGTVANDGTGDDLRTAGEKLNENFTELYAGLIGGTALTDMTAASALDGTELSYVVQGGNDRKATTEQERVWVSRVPQNSRSAAYTTVLSDAGKHIFHPSADTTARTWTIDSNANVPQPIGATHVFVNQNGAGVITIAITSDTMRLAGDGTTGSRTLAANGIATALKVTSTEWIISGTGLT